MLRHSSSWHYWRLDCGALYSVGHCSRRRFWDACFGQRPNVLGTTDAGAAVKTQNSPTTLSHRLAGSDSANGFKSCLRRALMRAQYGGHQLIYLHFHQAFGVDASWSRIFPQAFGSTRLCSCYTIHSGQPIIPGSACRYGRGCFPEGRRVDHIVSDGYHSLSSQNDTMHSRMACCNDFRQACNT